MKHLFSDLREFRRDPLNFLLARADGAPAPLEPLALGPKAHFLVTDPDLARELLRAPEADIDKGRLVRKLRLLLGESFLTMSGAEHARRRKVMHYQLQKGVAGQYVPEMAAVVRRSAAALVREEQFDAHAVTAPLALNLICVALFGHDVLASGDRQALIGAMKATEDELADEMFRAMPLLPWARIARRARRKRAREDMAFVVNRVRSHCAEGSVLRGLVELGLTDEQICDEIITMLIAGHHTAGTGGAWILYYLANEPGLADAVRDEVLAISDENGELRPQALSSADVSLALVNEVLRLFPSAWWFAREVQRPLVIKGVPLKSGTSLIISPWQFHRDRRFWQSPNKFRMDREHSGSAYMPFGAGPRVCVGMWVAKLELQLIALEFASAYRVNAIGELPQPWPRPSVTLIPPPIKLRLTLRGRRRLNEEAA